MYGDSCPAMKMTIFLLLLLLDDPEIEAQQWTEVNGQVYGHVLLRFIFPPFYNGYEKLCSKLYPGPFPVVNTRGYVNNFYKGRISRTEYNGEMYVMIWNLKPVDAGDYRCVVSSVNHIYSDFHLQIDSGRRRGPVPPRPRVRSTIRPSISSSSSDTSVPFFPSTSLKRRAVLSTPQWTSNLRRTIPQSCMLTYRHSAAPEVMTLTHTESLLGRWCTPRWLATNAEPECYVSVSFLAWWSQICLCCLDMLS
ncbi:uncharacterized protein LOC112222404 isoform X2 [Oncorhynchus tshawytscha]|uniref:uncharacterized protein LOC112222404 isoform X2 n=1 Tax=Oncorhynchus tshawytscha TaxID=74940 RepID=UPI001C3D6639|nr:uncharacterized protein LOC112222404 isoform X2 [Oncorhynchus tshawytscha]